MVEREAQQPRVSADTEKILVAIVVIIALGLVIYSIKTRFSQNLFF